MPLLNGDGAVQEWVGTITDIHESKLAAERLRASEKRYHALVTTTSSILWQAIANGSITSIADFDAYIRSQQDSLGSGWFAPVHPEDRERVITEWQSTIASEASEESEFRFTGASDFYRWVCCRAAPLKGPNGLVREWVGTVTDIHDKKEAEVRLILQERTLAAIAQGVLITNSRLPDHPIIYSNPAFVRLTG